VAPTNPGALTAKARVEAIKKALSLGLTPEFNTEGLSSEGIRVRDVISGHEWTFKISVGPDKLRLLDQQSTIHINPQTKTDYHPLIFRAKNYAESEMLKAGKIDRRAMG
jgi:hypothetical protein